MRSITSGDLIRGMVVTLLVIAVPCCLCVAGTGISRNLDVPADIIRDGNRAIVAVPIPHNADPGVTFRSALGPIRADLVQTAFIRDQKIGLYELWEPETISGFVSLDLVFGEEGAPRCVDAGPMTAVCSRALVGYDVAPSPASILGSGTTARCHSLQECLSAKADVLLITGSNIYESSYVDSLAMLWSVRMGLNVAIVDVGDISYYSPVEIRDFISDLYYTGSAEHFGDGRLGFVVLLGDAYENDNLTTMVPEYDGYGGVEKASDHFYACLSGSDDFEDVMIGRIPVGNEVQLINYYDKLASYTPLPYEDWTKSVLFAGGCYFADQADYVAYFDSLEASVGDDFSVSRFYRYDFPATDLGDAEACQAMVDSLNTGKLFVMYSGDGDKWDWGARWERVFRSDLIDDLDNSGRLPIVLSISCYSGFFDNVANPHIDGGVDCLAERLVLEPDNGAIACLASSREAGGSASVVFAPEIIKAAFVNGCSFLGELILEAKTQHLVKLGQVVLVRQFNLFGDPCLNYILNVDPVTAPDLVIRPYSVSIGPEFPLPGEAVEVTAELWNAGGVLVNACEVALYSEHPDSGGTPLATETVWNLCGWEKRSVTFTVSDVSAGELNAFVVADGPDTIEESDESNNSASAKTYIYPCEWGYPMKLGDDVEGYAIADLNGDGQLDILVTSGGTHATALDLKGNTLWIKNDLGFTQWHKGICPAAFDLNGDGMTEVILTTRSSLLVADGATGSTIWSRYIEYPAVPPIVTDVDGDGSFDIIAGTYTAPYSRIHVLDAAGNYVWFHDISGVFEMVTGIAVCDVELDGKKEVIYSTDKGNLKCLSCTSNPPTTLWETPLTTGEISCIVAGDMQRDGDLKIVASSDSTLFILGAADGEVTSTISMPACITNISLGNLDGDYDLEIVCVSGCGRIFEVDEGSIVLDVQTTGTPIGSPALGDIDHDGDVEIVIAMEEGTVQILDTAGSDVIEPIPLRGLCLSGPTAWDIDEDGQIEIVVGSSDSLLFILDLGFQSGRLEWMGEGCTGSRTNLYAQPLFGAVTDDVILTDRVDVVGDVMVDSTGCLTFQRGTDVRFVRDDISPSGVSAGWCEIIVDGELISAGTQTATISLRPVSIPCTKDEWMGIMLNENATATLTRTDICGAVTAIECYTSDTYISECRITDSSVGIKISGASPSIDHNLITGNSYGINSDDSSPTITGNLVAENYYSGVVLSGMSLAVLEDNIIEKTLQGHGLTCYSSSASILGGNKFRCNSLSGIYLSNSSPVIDSCWIGWNGDCGIKAAYYSDPQISKTSIVSNRVGVGAYVYANPVLGDSILGIGGDNDIRLNTLYAIYNTTPNEILAHGTWWGEDPPDPSDFAGPVDYSGWLIMPPAGIEDRDGASGLVKALYPNPFSGVIRLKLSVTQEQIPIAVSVYDITGRLIRRIAAVDIPGDFRAEWDGRDSHGNPVASGAYFFSITSRSRVHTRKVILLR